MESNNGKRTSETLSKKPLAEGYVLLLLSVGAYAATFAFEMGYCAHFQVPLELISIDTINFLQFGVVAALVAYYGFIIANYAVTILSCESVKKCKHSGPIQSLVSLGAPALLAIAATRGDLKVSIVVVAVAISFTLAEILERSVKRRHPEAKDDDNGFPLIRRAAESLGRRGYTTAVIAVGFVILSYFIGVSRASQQVEFLVCGDKPPLAVLRVYGDSIICASFNPTNRVVEPRFVFLEKKGSIERSFELKKIGPLQPRSVGR